MPTASPVPSRAQAAVRRRAGELATAATRQLEESHSWYADLSAQERAWVAQVAQAGIADFVAWLAAGTHGGPARPGAIFASAPRELTRSITLAQTLSLLREVVRVVESRVESVVRAEDVVVVREAILRYSSEVAFGAALVYAEAAEQRGAWDARLEALVLDAVLRGEVDESIRSQASALGWTATTGVVVVVGRAPAPDESGIEGVLSHLHRAAARRHLAVIAGVQGRRLVAVLGQVEDVTAEVSALADCFGDGPLVHGVVVDDLVEGALSAAAAMAGYDASGGWPACPRPCPASDLLPERALAGDEWARHELVTTVWEPLRAQPALLRTAEIHLDTKGGLEGTARALFVHVNTVRYRLGKITDATGYDLAEPHDAFTVRTALTIGRLLEVISNN